MQIRSRAYLGWVWGFAILWNLITAPATLFGAVPAIRQGPPVAWVALIFLFGGAMLLMWAMKLTLRQRRFGDSLFEAAGDAAIAGGPLRGTITVRNLPEDATLRLTLSCINRTASGSGKDRSVNEMIVWQDVQTVPPQALRPGPLGPIIPVAFDLPDSAPATSDADRNDRIFWRLQASAVLRGVDYDVQFEVPVAAGTREPDADASGHDRLSIALPAEAPARPEGSRILVEPQPGGGAGFTLPAGRNPGMAIGLGAFTILFGSAPPAIFLLMRTRSHGSVFADIPFVIAALFLLFTLLLASMTVYIGFVSTHVTAAPERLTITCRLLGMSWTRTIPSADVRDLRMKVRMQAGTTPYYDLIVETASGARAIVSSMLRDRREAEWLAGAIRCSLSR